MNESINLPKLIGIIASETGTDAVEVRRFLHEFFALIEQTLAAGEAVEIKGVGRFIHTDDPAEPVKYLADADLAALANEPFSAFEAVELADGISEEDLLPPAPEPVHQPEPTPAPEPTPTPEPTPDTVQEPAPAPGPVLEPAPEPEVEPEPELSTTNSESYKISETSEISNSSDISNTSDSVPAVSEPEPVPSYGTTTTVTVQSGQSHGALWLMAGIFIGLIIGLIAGYFAGKIMADIDHASAEYIVEENIPDEILTEVEDQTIVETSTPKDTDPQIDHTPAPVSAETPEAAAPAPQADVYDTVTSNRFLTTMAAAHYGTKNYWVFIYQANPGLGNPNSIRPGTRIKIPPRESFDAGSKAATDAKAQKLLNQLAQKYHI